MTKTISIELSKRINELGLLRDVETEYVYRELIWKNGHKNTYDLYKSNTKKTGRLYKTLTTDEAIEFLPQFRIDKTDNNDITKYQLFYKKEIIHGETLLEALENLITYLLDNNLIGKLN